MSVQILSPRLIVSNQCAYFFKLAVYPIGKNRLNRLKTFLSFILLEKKNPLHDRKTCLKFNTAICNLNINNYDRNLFAQLDLV